MRIRHPRKTIVPHLLPNRLEAGAQVETANRSGNFIMQSGAVWACVRVCTEAKNCTNLVDQGKRIEGCPCTCGLARKRWYGSRAAVIEASEKFLSPCGSRQHKVSSDIHVVLQSCEGKYLQSERKYWQVNRSSSEIRLRQRPTRKPEKTRFLHGRFSWEKKTIVDGCHHMKMVGGQRVEEKKFTSRLDEACVICRVLR